MINTLKSAGFKAVRENRNLLFFKEVESVDGSKREAIVIFGANKENKTVMSIFERITRYNVQSEDGMVFDKTEDDMIRATDIAITSISDAMSTLSKLGYNVVPQEQVFNELSVGEVPFAPTKEQEEATKRQEEEIKNVVECKNCTSQTELEEANTTDAKVD